MRYFLAVADELNFTRAANRLHTSQPSLSQQIRQLEAEVGVALLDRSRHHVALTDAGRVFLRETKDILGRIDHAGRLAKQAASGRAGDLSVGTFPAADVRILPGLRPLVATHMPNVRLVLHSKYALEPTMGLRTGALDVAFMALMGATVIWLFYRPVADDATGEVAHPSPRGSSRSAFLSPVAWMLALIVGLGGFGQFTVTYFVPSVAEALYGLDAAAAGVMISTGYLSAIAVNLIVGTLFDRFDKLIVLGVVFALLAVASSSLTIDNLVVFRIATAAVIGLGFTAANQLYGLAGSALPRHEAGHAMGIVSLGAGLFGYFGPQMVGILRDRTGSFTAGFYMVAAADIITLGLIALLYAMRRGETQI